MFLILKLEICEKPITFLICWFVFNNKNFKRKLREEMRKMVGTLKRKKQTKKLLNILSKLQHKIKIKFLPRKKLIFFIRITTSLPPPLSENSFLQDKKSPGLRQILAIGLNQADHYESKFLAFFSWFTNRKKMNNNNNTNNISMYLEKYRYKKSKKQYANNHLN